MKAKAKLHLNDGNTVKVADTIDELVIKVAQMGRSAPGSAFEFTRITDHGTAKRLFIPMGMVNRMEEL